MKSFLVCAVFCLCSVGAVLKLCSYHQLTIFRTDHAMILTRNNQAAVVGDICSSYEADEDLWQIILMMQRLNMSEF